MAAAPNGRCPASGGHGPPGHQWPTTAAARRRPGRTVPVTAVTLAQMACERHDDLAATLISMASTGLKPERWLRRISSGVQGGELGARAGCPDTKNKNSLAAIAVGIDVAVSRLDSMSRSLAVNSNAVRERCAMTPGVTSHRDPPRVPSSAPRHDHGAPWTVPPSPHPLNASHRILQTPQSPPHRRHRHCLHCLP